MRVSWIMAGCWLLAACGRPAYVETAYYGDLATLEKQIAAASREGSMDSGKVSDLARAVARREVWSARGNDALRRIDEARPCARAVESELSARAGGSDDTSGLALLVLVDGGLRNARTFVSDYARSERAAFRAVAARGTAESAHSALRRSYFSDPDERVRREAFRAARDAEDSGDLPGLLESARLDPAPRNRPLAAHAAGKIGGTAATLGLLDLWAAADDDTRIGIVHGWAEPRALDAGGARELVRAAQSSASTASVEAAAALVRIGRDGAAEGRGVLLRAIAGGTTEERVLAIRLTKETDAESIDAIEKAGTSDDPRVQVVALARLLEIPNRKSRALERLREIAQRRDGAARQARVALSVARDPAAAPLLEHQLADTDSAWRAQAALGLYRLGKAARMATALADPDPSVRMHVACAVLSGRLEHL